MMRPFIIIIKDNVVNDVKASTKEKCESEFLDAVEANVSNYDKYTDEDKDIILEQGYENFGNGSVCLTWVDLE